MLRREFHRQRQGWWSISNIRYFSYPSDPRPKRSKPPKFFLARTVEQIDTCAPTSLARLRATLLLSYLWLTTFQSHATKRYFNLVSLLSNSDLWCCAYQRACYNNKLWSPVSSIHPKTFRLLEALKLAACDGSFSWGGTGVLYLDPPVKMSIEATEEKQESFFQDEIVQEALLIILEPIYEARFTRRAFGYRPGRGPRDCLRFILGNFNTVSWTVKGDLSELFKLEISRVLGRVLGEVLGDETVMKLVDRGLKTPAPPVKPVPEKKNPKQRRNFEFEARRKPLWMEVILAFAPEEARVEPTSWGCLNKLGPLLANALLNQLDLWMEKQIEMFHRPHDPTLGLNFNTDEQLKPDNSRKLEYVRFGAHFLISVRGTRADVMNLMEKCRVFCKREFHLEPGFSSPVEITNPTSFLGHQMLVAKRLKTKWEPSSGKRGKISKAEKLVFCLDGDKRAAVESLKKVGILDEEENTKPCMRLFHEEQAHNNSHINKILRALGSWYLFSTNRDNMCEFVGYLFRSSLAKLYAAKYKLVTQVRVVKIGGMDLSEPMGSVSMARREENEFPEGLEFVYDVPQVFHAPIPENWKPEHEKWLRRVGKMLGEERLKEEAEAMNSELYETRGSCLKTSKMLLTS